MRGDYLKINITMNDELVTRIDDYIDKNYMSRSGFLSLAATKYLNENEVISALSDLSSLFKKISDTNSIDDETLKRLEDFEKLTKLLCEK